MHTHTLTALRTKLVQMNKLVNSPKQKHPMKKSPRPFRQLGTYMHWRSVYKDTTMTPAAVRTPTYTKHDNKLILV